MAKQRTKIKIIERKVVETERICPICQAKFWGTGRAIYSSLECKRKADYERHSEARREHRREMYQAGKKAVKKTAGKK
jgi:tRNA(Ile2) C34 agmatinyltransferase TiaS